MQLMARAAPSSMVALLRNAGSLWKSQVNPACHSFPCLAVRVISDTPPLLIRKTCVIDRMGFDGPGCKRGDCDNQQKACKVVGWRWRACRRRLSRLRFNSVAPAFNRVAGAERRSARRAGFQIWTAATILNNISIRDSSGCIEPIFGSGMIEGWANMDTSSVPHPLSRSCTVSRRGACSARKSGWWAARSGGCIQSPGADEKLWTPPKRGFANFLASSLKANRGRICELHESNPVSAFGTDRHETLGRTSLSDRRPRAGGISALRVV